MERTLSPTLYDNLAVATSGTMDGVTGKELNAGDWVGTVTGMQDSGSMKRRQYGRHGMAVPLRESDNSHGRQGAEIPELYRIQ